MGRMTESAMEHQTEPQKASLMESQMEPQWALPMASTTVSPKVCRTARELEKW